MLNNMRVMLPPDNDGFTLIETLAAMVILVIGIFALYSMQITSLRYNATASAITTSSTWAADRVEQLLALDYADLVDTSANGVAGLSDTTATADGQAVSPDGRYTIFWNVAPYLAPNPGNPADSTVKALRIIVQHNDLGTTKQVVVNYYKQKVF